MGTQIHLDDILKDIDTIIENRIYGDIWGEIPLGLKKLLNGYEGLNGVEKRVYYVANKLKFAEYENDIQKLLKLSTNDIYGSEVNKLKDKILINWYKKINDITVKSSITIVEDDSNGLQDGVSKKVDYSRASDYKELVEGMFMANLFGYLFILNFWEFWNWYTSFNSILVIITIIPFMLSLAIATLFMLMLPVFFLGLLYKKCSWIYGKNWEVNYYKYIGGTPDLCITITRDKIESEFKGMYNKSISECIEERIEYKKSQYTELNNIVKEHENIKCTNLYSLMDENQIT